MRNKYNQISALAAARKRHGNQYDYSKMKYVNMVTKVVIICKVHGVFKKTPNNHIHLGQGCPQCRQIRYKGKTANGFIIAAREVHGDKYSYDRSVYVAAKKRITLTCPSHGDFSTTPDNHLHGSGCPVCRYSKASSTLAMGVQEFKCRSKAVHGNTYIYTQVEYVNNSTKVSIKCRKHGIFEQAPAYHIAGGGCPLCTGVGGYSRVAIEWLKYESKKRRLKIQHAENGGEFRLPSIDKVLFVDGYNKYTNTVFEFHGDAYHGNPKRYSPRSKPHPFRKDATAQRLYKETKEREKLIRALGYKLVVMWESNWLKIRGGYPDMQKSSTI